MARPLDVLFLGCEAGTGRLDRLWGLLCGLCVVLLSAPAAAHYVRLDGALIEKGVLTYGIALTGAPFASKRDGALRGFEIDVARAVAKAHGLSLKTVRLPRARLSEALESGKVDAVNSLALDRPVPGIRVLPYLVVGDHVMVLRGNPFRIDSEADLAGRTVAATSGSSAEAFAAEVNQGLLAEGRTPMNVHTFPDQRFTHFPVSMGHAAAYFVQTVSAVATTRDPESRARLVPGAFKAEREVGFAVPADNETLVHAVEHALAAMVATGKYRALLEDHGLPEDLSAYR